MKKTKIFVISDHPLAPSGVGTQTKYFIDALLETGKYKFVCFGGAMKHESYEPVKTEQWGDDLVIIPVDGYGSHDSVRSLIRTENPDILWFMTDPRFYEWLWDIENEVRPLMPMIYYHVWDNFPAPMYNKKFYESNDVIACISKLTRDVVSEVAPDVWSTYLPHAVNDKIFKKRTKKEIEGFKKEHFEHMKDKVIFFWNNRNARRKQSGTLVYWFNEFAEQVGPENVCLIMHTDPKDPNGQDLNVIMQSVGATDGRIMISPNKVPSEGLATIYNMVDCTINISDAEGFGLATLESLACGTPIIVNMTGGLQEQVTDGEEWFGVGLEPASKSIIGSQQVPYIFEDRLNKEDFIAALHKIYNMSPEEREGLGEKGRQHVLKNYNFENFKKQWNDLIEEVVEKCGSWEERKGYKAWDIKEVVSK
jgi:glycosyltransferase involved in cell wall biosynthesis